jgi:putative Holliday junction resolvase
MTTKAAEELLIAADVSRKKRKGVVDRVAAAILLQSYLEAQRATPTRVVSGGTERDRVEEWDYSTENDQFHDSASDRNHPRHRHRTRRPGRLSDDAMD